MQRFILICSIVFLFISATLFGFIYFSGSQLTDDATQTAAYNQPSVFTEEEIFPSTEEDKPHDLYLIQTYHKHIALFHYNDNATPVLIEELDTNVSTLREEDRRLLSAGILINSQEEAERILENFEN